MTDEEFRKLLNAATKTAEANRKARKKLVKRIVKDIRKGMTRHEP